MRGVGRDVLTGLTAILALAGLGLMLLWFGELSGRLERTYEVVVRAPTSGGIKESSPVTLNGVKVGQVASVRNVLDDPRYPPVELVLALREGVVVPRACVPSVDKALIGEASLEFTTPAGLAVGPGTPALAAGGEPLVAMDLSTALDRLASRVQAPLETITRGGESVERLARVYAELGEGLKALVEPRTPGQVDSGASPNISSTLSRLDGALAGASRWLEDEPLRAGLAGVVERAGRVLESAEATVEGVRRGAEGFRDAADKAGKAAEGVGQLAADARERLAALAGDVRATLAGVDAASGELAGALSAIRRGEGTLGQMATNPDLYHNMRSAAARLDKALLELELVLQKVRAEGVKVGL